MKFVVEGTVRNDTETRAFVRQVDAGTEQQAVELVLSLLGSEQGIKRTRVRVAKIEKI